MALIPRNTPSADELARRGVGVEKPKAKPAAKKTKKSSSKE
jgi:hypothetical protein